MERARTASRLATMVIPALVAAIAAPPVAFARDGDTPANPEPSAAAVGLESPQETSFWGRGRVRGFLATMIDLGFLYLRPRGMLGYGRPFYRWVGLEANPIFSTTYVGGYGGVRGSLPSMDLRLGARFMKQLGRSYLQEQADDSYSQPDSEDRTIDGSASYLELEAEYSASVDLGPGNLVAVLTGTLVTGVPSGELVYEDTIRIVANAPGFFRGRLGYSIPLDSEHAVNVGLVGEVIGIPGRGDHGAYVFRGGIVASVMLWPDLEVRASFIPAIVGPDSLGVSGGDFAQLGIRWLWATGSRPEEPPPPGPAPSAGEGAEPIGPPPIGAPPPVGPPPT